MTRREFLERAGCAAAVLAAARLRLRGYAGSAGQAAAAQGRMFISLNGSLTRGVSGADKIRLAAKLGYGGVDWDLGPAKTAGLEATKALFVELKIAPTIVGLPMARPLPFGGEDAAFAEALKKFEEDAAFISAVGCRKMMLVLPASTQRPKPEQRKIVLDRLAAMGAVLAKSNIRLGIEFLGPLYFRLPRPDGPPVEPFIWNMPEAVALAKDAGPNVGVILDAWHWHHSNSTVADILAAGEPRIVHIHVSDAKAAPPADVRDDHRLMPGEGIVDLAGFFGALKKVGYAGGVSPEPLGRIPADLTPEAAATLALDTTTAVMKKAGVL